MKKLQKEKDSLRRSRQESLDGTKKYKRSSMKSQSSNYNLNLNDSQKMRDSRPQTQMLAKSYNEYSHH